jgi:hypothetical protein
VSAIDRGFDTRTGKSKEKKISSIKECKQGKAWFVSLVQSRHHPLISVFMKREFEGVPLLLEKNLETSEI